MERIVKIFNGRVHVILASPFVKKVFEYTLKVKYIWN